MHENKTILIHFISSYCNDTICYGTLGSGWVATCHNTQVQAELHLNFAEQIRKNIVENLQVNTLQLEDQLKQVYHPHHTSNDFQHNVIV
jgi:hypothetical protein